MIAKELPQLESIQSVPQKTWDGYTESMFNIMRMLKDLNPGDTYLESYEWHRKKNGDKFFDHYHLAWWYGMNSPRSRCLEIGTRTGISTAMLLAAHKFGGRIPDKVICVDPWNDGFANPGIVRMNLKELSLPTDSIEFLKAKSEDLFRLWETQKPEPFDWILIDGDHTPEVAAEDLKGAIKHLAHGGILIFDDISPDGCNLESVWDEWYESLEDREAYSLPSKNMHGKGTAWLLKK